MRSGDRRLAEYVGADMDVMIADAHRMRRHQLPVIAQSLVRTPDAPEVAAWVRDQLGTSAGTPPAEFAGAT